MSFDVFALLSFSIFIAAGFGVYRFKLVDPGFYPFIGFTVLASLNEIYSYVVVAVFKTSNIPNNNIYVLLEAFILTWQFFRWNLFGQKEWKYYTMQSLFLLIWFAEWYSEQSLYVVFHLYRIAASALLSFFALGLLSKLTFSNLAILSKDSRFIICLAVITLYPFKIFTELFWLFGSISSHGFLYNIYEWFGYINFIINLFLILAVIWIPKKPRYITFT